MKKNNIVLIGFMGSGKTTVGIRLSYRLRRIVEDTDKLIEKKIGRTISDIFATEGEDYFRKLETGMLEELCGTCTNKIISVGGGTPVRKENRTLLQELGTVIYLRVRPETVYRRLQGDTTRPLLRGENPQEKIRQLMEARREAYETCADLIMDVDELDINAVLDKIEEYVERMDERS